MTVNAVVTPLDRSEQFMSSLIFYRHEKDISPLVVEIDYMGKNQQLLANDYGQAIVCQITGMDSYEYGFIDPSNSALRIKQWLIVNSIESVEFATEEDQRLFGVYKKFNLDTVDLVSDNANNIYPITWNHN